MPSTKMGRHVKYFRKIRGKRLYNNHNDKNNQPLKDEERREWKDDEGGNWKKG